VFWLQPSSTRLATATRTNRLIAFDFMGNTSIHPLAMPEALARQSAQPVWKRVKWQMGLQGFASAKPAKRNTPRPAVRDRGVSEWEKEVPRPIWLLEPELAQQEAPQPEAVRVAEPRRPAGVLQAALRLACFDRRRTRTSPLRRSQALSVFSFFNSYAGIPNESRIRMTKS
jgi:hypothetical protein